ncbi:alpha/beta hydrolase [Kistimonas asteriae]|uniref:alpha/beta hydrolase n=1 Tax=Kistimonas asteriae TaxID=517724 RepID=UPI001BA892B1|nr:alpha/beta hydrolase [Kistimonas asteriae]
MNRQIIENLKSSLPALELGNTLEPDANLRAYLDFYAMSPEHFLPGVQHDIGYLEVDGYHLATHVWRPEHPVGTVFLVHGYYDHAGLYGHLVRFWLEEGYAVMVHDLPGHGLSSGSIASIDCFSRYSMVFRHCLEWASGKLSSPWFLQGQSTGGAIITDTLVNYPELLARYEIADVFLMAPLVRPMLWRMGLVQYFMLRTFVSSVPRSRSNNSNDQAFLEFLANDPLQSNVLPVEWVGALHQWIRRIESYRKPCPCSPLIIQGQRDRTVNWQHNLKVLKRLYTKPDVFFIPDGCHHLANEIESIREQYFEVIRKRLAKRQG